jgi:hypothetical protein
MPSLPQVLTPYLPSVRRFFQATTFCWIIVYASYRLQENYPFSNNPMYTRWDDETYVLYTTDQDGKTLFFQPQFGQTAIRLKKMVKSRVSALKKDPKTQALGEDEHYRMAGEEALRHFDKVRFAKANYTGLQLWRQDMKLDSPGQPGAKRVIATFTPVTQP